MAANSRAKRNLLKEEDAQALGKWLRYRVKDIGVTMKEFANITGIAYAGVLARIGKAFKSDKGNGRTVPVCLSIDEVKIVAKELGVPALYIFIAFNYPGYSIKTHIKDADVKAIEAIGKIRNEANNLLRADESSKKKEPRKQRPSIKDEDSETIYIPIHIGAFRKQLREKFTEDVAVNVAFDVDHVAIDISSKKLGIDRHYDMAPWDLEMIDAALIISTRFQQDVIDILFKKEGDNV